MNKNLLTNESKSAFNYTLLLDDVVQLNTPTPQKFCTDFNPSFVDPCNDFKLGIAECRTQAVNPHSENDFDIISPMKSANFTQLNGERMRKSDGALRLANAKKANQIHDFLSETSEDDDEFPILESDQDKKHETKSEIAKIGTPNFSLSSCFKNHFSHFNNNSFGSSKININLPVKINKARLKGALKNVHFENIIAKLSLALEKGKSKFA